MQDLVWSGFLRDGAQFPLSMVAVLETLPGGDLLAGSMASGTLSRLDLAEDRIARIAELGPQRAGGAPVFLQDATVLPSAGGGVLALGTGLGGSAMPVQWIGEDGAAGTLSVLRAADGAALGSPRSSRSGSAAPTISPRPGRGARASRSMRSRRPVPRPGPPGLPPRSGCRSSTTTSPPSPG